MSRTPDENSARIYASMIRHELTRRDFERAREKAAEAILRGDPMVPELRDAIADALTAPPRKRGERKGLPHERWFSIGLDYYHLRGQCGLSSKDAYAAMAGRPEYGNIDIEALKDRVAVFNKRWPGILEDLHERERERLARLEAGGR
ncbi:hypothetical protein RDV64_01565 [Acuticoccus sp. MNP-M23]|uniref:hypothetical protein n=1 Tax=Acuticoccus sp. MNP-M23 TaxID=3072793 RepID=UPI00281592CF|nr:hypothetical protein [Acuticoccus sp. MNP-M23]WMS43120.1 hypothetical protein RDV64_01565 [Acuticoccus sp. MNP-M23]